MSTNEKPKYLEEDPMQFNMAVSPEAFDAITVAAASLKDACTQALETLVRKVHRDKQNKSYKVVSRNYFQ